MINNEITTPLLDKHFQSYLEKVHSNPGQIPRIQLIETRRAFIAGMATMFLEQLAVTELEDNLALERMENLSNEISDLVGSM